MNIEFESDYRSKVLFISFRESCTLSSSADVLKWRSLWTQALSSWHSPYKALIDCSRLSLDPQCGDLEKSLETMMVFLKGFFLKKAVGYGYHQEQGHDRLPFPVLSSEDEARSLAGLRGERKAGGDSLRSRILLDNHFRQHVVEMTFSEEVFISSETELTILSDKLTNNLMQWHSAWSLLIDCSRLRINPELEASFQRMEKRFRGFFLKKVIGYAPASKDEVYPFQVFRARHRAAAELESEGLFSGEDAQCRSKKQPPPG